MCREKGDIQNKHIQKKADGKRQKKAKPTLKRKFLRWSGPLWWTMTNSGCNIRCLLHSSMRAETGCFPAQERQHRRKLWVFVTDGTVKSNLMIGSHYYLSKRYVISMMDHFKNGHYIWRNWQNTTESVLTFHTVSVENATCSILLSIWYREYCIVTWQRSIIFYFFIAHYVCAVCYPLDPWSRPVPLSAFAPFLPQQLILKHKNQHY